MLKGSFLLERRQGMHQKASLGLSGGGGCSGEPQANRLFWLVGEEAIRSPGLMIRSLKAQLCLKPTAFPHLHSNQDYRPRPQLSQRCCEGRLVGEVSLLPFLSAQPRRMLGTLHGTPGCAASPQKPSQDRHTEPRAEFFKGEASLPLHIHPVKYHLRLLLTAQEAERGCLQRKDKVGAVATGEGSGPLSKNVCLQPPHLLSLQFQSPTPNLTQGLSLRLTDPI